MNRIYISLISIVCLVITSCSTTAFIKKSQFNANLESIGMSKTNFILKYGEPYKMSFYYDKNNTLYEELYYKEQIFNTVYFTINTVVVFKDSLLISQGQKDEKRLYSTCNCE